MPEYDEGTGIFTIFKGEYVTSKTGQKIGPGNYRTQEYPDDLNIITLQPIGGPTDAASLIFEIESLYAEDLIDKVQKD